jgi:peroxiredoxin
MGKRAMELAAVLAILVLSAFSQTDPSTGAIVARIKTLRQLPDSDRSRVTKELALEIRRLPAGPGKIGLANSLANLATEGDFGRDTLQEVAATLASGLRESPVRGGNGQPAGPYVELATLVKYEHLDVHLDAVSEDPQFAAAMAKLDAADRLRDAADFTLTDLKGADWTLRKLRGKVVLVNFWATWCPPCRKEMPDLDALYEQFKDKGFVILAISDEDAAKVNPYLHDHPVSYPVMLDPGRKVNQQFQVEGIPKSFIYNREGKLAAESIDMRTKQQFLELLSQAGLQ